MIRENAEGDRQSPNDSDDRHIGSSEVPPKRGVLKRRHSGTTSRKSSITDSPFNGKHASQSQTSFAPSVRSSEQKSFPNSRFGVSRTISQSIPENELSTCVRTPESSVFVNGQSIEEKEAGFLDAQEMRAVKIAVAEGTSRTDSSSSVDMASDPRNQQVNLVSVANLLTSSNIDIQKLQGKTEKETNPLKELDPAAQRQAQFDITFGKVTKKYEAINYHIPASLVNRKYYFPRTASQEIEKYIASWFLILLMAVMIAIVGLAMNLSVKLLYVALYRLCQTHLIETEQLGAALTGFVYALVCCGFAVLSVILVVYVGPQAMGSGISEVKSYLNGTHIPGLFALNTFVAKVLGVSLSISSGLIAGREGPIIHVGAIIGSACSQAASKIFRCRLKKPVWMRYFRSNEWKRDFAVMGSAVGVAVAFWAPLGGTLFAVEEGATHWRQQLTFYTFLACLVGAFVSMTLQQLINGINPAVIAPAVYGSYSNQGAEIVFTGRDLPFALLLSLVGGITGAFFATVQRRLMKFRMQRIVRPWRKMVEAFIVTSLLAFLRFSLPYWVGSCRPMSDNFIEDTLGERHAHELNYARFYCAEDEYNDWAILFWNPLENALRTLLHAKNDVSAEILSVGTLFAAFAFFYGFTTIVYGLAVPAGLFIPSFLIGASYGRLIGILQHHTYKDERSAHIISSYAFLGSASCLGGMTRVTISVAAIALEATHNMEAAFYAFVVTILAKLIADSFNIGIYDLTIELKKIPFLISELSYEFTELRAENAMNPHVRSLQEISSVGTLVQTLREYNHHGFPVVNQQGTLVGTISRIVVLRLLEQKAFGINPPILSRTHLDSAWPNFSMMRGANQMVFLDEIELLHRGKVVDLRPYIDPETPIIDERTPLSLAHWFLRDGGFRHVLVAPKQSIKICGILVREDIVPGRLEKILESRREQERIRESQGEPMPELRTAPTQLDVQPFETPFLKNLYGALAEKLQRRRRSFQPNSQQ